MAKPMHITDPCPCGGSIERPNEDCERCMMVVRISRLREALHRQTAFTQEVAARIHREVVDVLVTEGVVPDGINPNGHPTAQVVAVAVRELKRKKGDA
jgi:hypothetical protein